MNTESIDARKDLNFRIKNVLYSIILNITVESVLRIFLSGSGLYEASYQYK